jgi:hypothetical protein
MDWASLLRTRAEGWLTKSRVANWDRAGSLSCKPLNWRGNVLS